MVDDGQRLGWTREIAAVLFDMDGTLLDSEHLTARAIDMLLAKHDVQLSLQGPWFHGITWVSIAATLRTHAPVLKGVEAEAALQNNFHTALIDTDPPAIPGAPAAVRAASSNCATAVVSSSDRASVLHVVERLELAEHLDQLVAAEDCQRSKPDPQCFQIAAQRLGVNSKNCLVFEDSVAGLRAARAAGMHTIAIGKQHAQGHLADFAIADFTELPHGFFDEMGCA